MRRKKPILIADTTLTWVLTLLILISIVTLVCVGVKQNQSSVTIAEVEAQVAKLSSEVKAKEEEPVPEVDNSFSIVMIADSYGSGYQTHAPQIDGWVRLLKNKLPVTDVSIQAVPGTGFAKEERGQTFETMLISSLDNVADPNEVDCVLVCGGYNDIVAEESEILNAGDSFIDTMRKYYPNATLVLGVIGWNDSDWEIQNILNDRVIPAYKEIVANQPDAVYLDGAEQIMRTEDNRYFSDDTVHPNEDGEEAIANWLCEQLPKQFPVLQDMKGDS